MDDYELCLKLQEAIAMGNSNAAKNYVTQLATKKANISLFKMNEKDLVTDIHKKTQEVLCNIHSQLGQLKSVQIYISYYTKVSELKNIVKIFQNISNFLLRFFFFNLSF